MRKLISTGSPWEAGVGCSRAVIVDDTIYVSGTSGLGPDAYDQAKDALAVIERVLAGNGFTLAGVVHSRLSVADFDHWKDAARAHGEVHGQVRPAFALVHALPFIDNGILVEVEAIVVRSRR